MTAAICRLGGVGVAGAVRTRIEDALFDTVQKAGVRMYALRGETMARLLTPKGLADPYPVYDELRSQGELIVSERFKIYLATTHALVSGLARDPRLSVDNRLVEGYQVADLSEDAIQDHEMMLRMDDPDHARIRRLVGAAFSPRAVASWRPMVEKLCHSLLDDVDPRGFDVVNDYAVPLTVKVICELMGVPGEDWRSFRQWGSDATASMGAMNSRANIRRSRDGMRALFDYFSELIERRRRSPGDDLLSVMIAAEEEGDRLSDRELVANSILLLIAGFETTVNLVGNGTVALLEHRDQWDRLRDDPELTTNAVEELLRFDSSVQFTSRNVREATEIAGQSLGRGAQLILMLGSANRDPAVFDGPARLDVGRDNARSHVSFSSGTHHCLGANLARLEGDVAFRTLIGRFPELQVAARPQRRPTDLMRGYERVPVRAG
ncbi:MAG TPA: cytochrome P450 [Acidimicrobiales bacterium]|nr:cytochrome P450 [Acidimicrobiales bacterium]